jgi:hypothetical protein
MDCEQRAVLVITSSVDGTSTSVARQRIELVCGLPKGHSGAHHDARHDEDWESPAGTRPTLLRDEDEEK